MMEIFALDGRGISSKPTTLHLLVFDIREIEVHKLIGLLSIISQINTSGKEGIS